MEENDNKSIKQLVKYTLIGGVIIIVSTFLAYWKTGHLLNNDIDSNYLSAFGDFIGGFLGSIVGLVTVYLVYLTYSTQKQELQRQRELIDNQNKELVLHHNYERLSNLIEIYKKSLLNLNMGKKDYSPGEFPYHQGIEVINNDLGYLADRINEISKEESVTEKEQRLLEVVDRLFSEKKIIFYSNYFFNLKSIFEYIETIGTEGKDYLYTIFSNSISVSEQYFIYYYSHRLSADKLSISLKENFKKLSFYENIDRERFRLSQYSNEIKPTQAPPTLYT